MARTRNGDEVEVIDGEIAVSIDVLVRNRNDEKVATGAAIEFRHEAAV